MVGFAKYALLRLGVHTDITRFVRGKLPRRIASRQEVLERTAEPDLNVWSVLTEEEVFWHPSEQKR